MKAPTKKKTVTKKISEAKKIAEAKKLRAGFRYTAGGRKNQKSTVKIRAAPKESSVRVVVGKIDAIEYSVIGETGKRLAGQSFRHEFTGKSCPTLTVSSDGKQMYIEDGSYIFKTDGINDIK